MSMPIDDHTKVLKVHSKTISKLKAINIETLEDLAETSVEKIRLKLECTKERAQTLIYRARRAVSGKMHHREQHKKALSGSDADDPEFPK